MKHDVSMSLLGGYLTNEDSLCSVETLRLSLADHMACIKHEAESLDSLCLTDEAFQHQIASFCLDVEILLEQVSEAELGIERFVQNTYKKWRTYYALHQDLTRLYTAKTVDNLARTPKLERTSNLNVIKVSGHFIDMHYKNKALVIPDTTTTTSETKNDATSPPILEIFQPGASRDMAVQRGNELVGRFAEAQDKIRVYQTHYGRLGNLLLLAERTDALRCHMDEVRVYIEENIPIENQLHHEMTLVMYCFDEIRRLLSKECENCAFYMLNTVAHFTECATTYHKLLGHLRRHGVILDTLEVALEQNEATRRYCASMYQQFSEFGDNIT